MSCGVLQIFRFKNELKYSRQYWIMPHSTAKNSSVSWWWFPLVTHGNQNAYTNVYLHRAAMENDVFFLDEIGKLLQKSVMNLCLSPKTTCSVQGNGAIFIYFHYSLHTLLLYCINMQFSYYEKWSVLWRFEEISSNTLQYYKYKNIICYTMVIALQS